MPGSNFLKRPTSATAVIVSLALLVGACKNPFSTREAEKPLGQTGTWSFPASPDLVLRNLLFSFNERVVANYTTCFSSDFIYAVDFFISGVPDTSRSWGNAAELELASKLFNFASAHVDSLNYVLSLAPDPSRTDIRQDTLAIFFRTYQILQLRLKPQPPETTVYAGVATFHLRQDSFNFWALDRWDDQHQSSTIPSWGDLKASFR